MAVAVRVAVVALGAGVVGRLLQPHQHVHLGREREHERLSAWQSSASGLFQAPALSSRLTLGCSPQQRPWLRKQNCELQARLPGFQSCL